MPSDDKIDGRIRELVEGALSAGMPGDGAAAAALTEAVLSALHPSFGAAAQRRRLTSELRAAYKEGFLSGRSAGRFARWHGEIWNRSAIAMRLRRPTKADVEAQTRYARYNID